MLVGLTAGDNSLAIEGSTLVSLAIEGTLAGKFDDGQDIMFITNNVGVYNRSSKQNEANDNEIYQMSITGHGQREMRYGLGIIGAAAQPVGVNDCM